MAEVGEKYRLLEPVLDERQRRLWAAAEARALGWGGVSVVSEATGLSRVTIHKGVVELEELGSAPRDDRTRRVRRPGGGRKPLEHHDPELPAALDALVEPVTRGHPESPLRWTCKSTRKLAQELCAQGHETSPQKVAELLYDAGYRLQANRKSREGAAHPDRNAQFEHIHEVVQRFQARGQPVISVDTKKKELVGDFKNAGEEWRPQGTPELVRTHDFIDKELGKAIPYGVYDLTANNGWVNVGIDHDTPEFAVESIRRWWHRMGRHAYPDAQDLLINADAGGSNGYRARAWKMELAHFATEQQLTITVCHFPPGTSKWNKIEHRMFCHITENWRGQPLVSREAIVSLIGATTTRTGLHIKSALDTDSYATGVKIPDKEFAQLPITPDRFHGDWNYVISPSE